MRREATFSMILSRNEKAALDAVARSFERSRSDAVRLLVRQAAQSLPRSADQTNGSSQNEAIAASTAMASVGENDGPVKAPSTREI